MNSACLTGAGGSQPRPENMMPVVAIDFIIATEGIYPSRG